MSATRILLVSLLFNVAALASIGYLSTRPSPAPANGATAGTTAKSADGKLAPITKVINGQTVVVSQDFNWSAVETDDFRKYIANLRSINCPEETVKDIIIADVNKLYAPRFAALNKSTKEYRFWEARNTFGDPTYDRDREKQRRDLTKEKKDLIKELLGVDIDEEARKLSGYPDYEERSMGFLSKEKRELVREIQRKYSELEQDVYRKSQGRVDAEDQAELKKIRAARHDELAKVLTPQELTEYELRNSQTATQMRYDLAAFDPNEDEFRKIFAARDEFDSLYGRGFSPDESPEDRKARTDAQKKLDESLKAALGDDRYAEYQRSRDYSYQELARLSTRYDLPKETAGKIWDMKKAAEDQVRKLRMDSSLASDARNAALKAIRDETQKSVNQLMGDRAFKSYKSSGGYWLNNLSPSISSPAPTVYY